MSRSFGQQVGRHEISFSPLLDGGLRPKSSVDKFYDVKLSRKQPNISLADRSTRPPTEKKSIDTSPTFMTYNINRSQVETASPNCSFDRVPRGLGTDLDHESQKLQVLEKKRQYKAMQDELKEKEGNKRTQRVSPFAKGLGHDSIVVGAAQVEPDNKPPLSWNSINVTHVPGGKFPKAERMPSSKKSDMRDYSPNWERTMFKHTASISMHRQASREATHATATPSPEQNRAELQQLIRRVERDLHTTDTSIEFSPSPTKTLDFFLAGGRADVPVHGIPPPAHLLVKDTVEEIDGHTSRLQIQLFNLERGEKIEQQRKAKWHAKAMTQQQLQKYRQTNEYKLNKQYRIFQDQELVKLTEDIKGKDASKFNIAGSTYRLNLLAHQLEGKRQANLEMMDLDEDDD